MFNKEDLLKRHNYLLTKYQNEIYRQLVNYMKSNNLNQKDVAEQLHVSNAYISQVLNGNFNSALDAVTREKKCDLKSKRLFF